MRDRDEVAGLISDLLDMMLVVRGALATGTATITRRSPATPSLLTTPSIS
jgi:hypothetical protein